MKRAARSIWVVVAMAVAVAAAGCGLQPDEAPQAIESELLEPTATTTVDAAGSRTLAVVYLLRREQTTTLLAEVERAVEDPTSAADRIEAVLEPVTPEEQARGLVSSIPADTVLLDTELDETRAELIVNLSGALFDVEGKELANAFAQLVLTATDLEGVRSVRFEVDGEPYRAPNAEGIEQEGAVTAADYASLLDR